MHSIYVVTDLSWLATSVDVERLFSQGRLLLPYVRNGLSAQSVRALLCLGDWARLDLISDEDVLHVTAEKEVDENEADENETDDDVPVDSVIDISVL